MSSSAAAASYKVIKKLPHHVPERLHHPPSSVLPAAQEIQLLHVLGVCSPVISTPLVCVSQSLTTMVLICFSLMVSDVFRVLMCHLRSSSSAHF